MRQFLIFLSFFISSFFANLALAETSGPHISVEKIEIDDTTSIPAGAEVNFLGIIDVTLSVVESGRLATFTYGDRIYNADAALFYKAIRNAKFSVAPLRAFDAGNSASICSALIDQSLGTLEFREDTYARYFEITHNGQIVDGYSISRPTDIYSWRDRNSEFCISGLDYSKLYDVTLRPGLTAGRNGFVTDLDKPITSVVKTPDVTPSIKLDSAKTILSNSENAVIPIEYVNLDEIEVTLYRVDLASLPSYTSVLQNLDGRDIKTLENFWADKIAKKTINIESRLNEHQTINLNFSDVVAPNTSGLFVATFDSPQLDTSYRENRPTQWFSISDASVQIFKGLNTTDVFIKSFQSAEHIANASITVLAKNNRTLFDGTTDASGRIQISNTLISGTGGFAPEFIIVTSKEVGTSILKVASLDEKPRFLNGGEIKNKATDVYLTSDRETYRAGDSVNVFGVTRELNLDPIIDRELYLKLIDRNDDVIAMADIVSDQNGAFAWHFELKPNTMLGRYKLQIESIDETILAQHTISVEDFVPLTINPKLEIQNSIWALGEIQEMSLSAEYYSGGAASGLKGEISTFVRTTNKFQGQQFADFTFGNSPDVTVTAIGDVYAETLDKDGQLTATLVSDYQADPSRLYEVLIDGTVFDVGGRSNKTSEIIPLETVSAYVGVRPRFDNYVGEGIAPSFDVVNIDRSGAAVELSGIQYSVNRIYYRYNWTYDGGWRWNRIRVDDEVVASGVITDDILTLKKPLNWGRHEIVITNANGFTTLHEFYVGWGSDAKPASEPEELVLSYSDGTLRGEAGFAGNLSVLIADEDINSVQTISVQKGSFAIPVNVDDASEPGVHLLASLIRPIETGSEHLPQISLGKVWIPTVGSNRELGLSIDVAERIDSATPVSVRLKSNNTTGSAVVFIVDEGIHALTKYENENLNHHYLSERALNYGIMTNFGELISQDLALSTFRVGGDGDMLSSSAAVDKSEFFKTIAYASPLLKIENGVASFTFPETLEWEGQLRVVAFAVDQTGFGFAETNATVQDPVSLDVSMPRFITPSDTIIGKMNVRWNSHEGPVEIFTKIGAEETSTKINQPTSDNYELAFPLKANAVGDIPIQIEVATRDHVYTRNYTLVSRQVSYPITELQSVKLDKQNWLGFGSVLVQPFNAKFVDLNVPGSEISASLTTSLGLNLNQAVSELNRYPYGCVEQVSSKARGLIAYSDVRGLTQETSDRIQIAIEKLLAKQKYSGAFGYWDRNSAVYERFQPYALDTLKQLLPYAKDKNRVIASINSGLEYLYRTQFDKSETELYALGLLAKSGFEVTSRARYAIDQSFAKIKSASFNASISPYRFSQSLDDLTLAYWVAAQFNDTKRMMQLSEKARLIYNQIAEEQVSVKKSEGAWFSVNESSNFYGLYAKSAKDNAHLLTDLNEVEIAPIFKTILSNTHEYLAKIQYRSTERTAKLVKLQNYQKRSLGGTKVTIDDQDYQLDDSGSLPVTLDQLKWGFELSHDASLPLYLNVKSTGQRRGLSLLNNGYQVQKFWYDRNGNEVDISSGILPAKQGDLFTVVVEIDRTKSGHGSDLLITDLLPAGFEIEKATLADPTIDGMPLEFEQGMQASYTASMDDRFIGHFDNRWKSGSFGFVRYSVRASYETDAIIPDAVVEEMYAPEINGRSSIVASQVIAK